MAKGGGSRRRDASPPHRRRRAVENRPVEPEAEASGPFILGVIPGATPGTWIDRWNERMPRHPLELRTIAVATQREQLLGGELSAALVRLPIELAGLHVIALYEELAVVVVPSESHLTAADELELSDLAGEVIIAPRDDVLDVAVPDAAAASFDPPETTADAIATVATGVGVAIVPMSLARLHARRDVASRPLRDGPTSTVALAWVADRTTPAVEAFVGIVRGRTPNSSRG